MIKRIYVGHKRGGASEVFRSAETPTADTHPQYFACTGPFRTHRAAVFMASPAGDNNPHCRCVAEAEKIIRQIDKKSK